MSFSILTLLRGATSSVELQSAAQGAANCATLRVKSNAFSVKFSLVARAGRNLRGLLQRQLRASAGGGFGPRDSTSRKSTAQPTAQSTAPCPPHCGSAVAPPLPLGTHIKMGVSTPKRRPRQFLPDWLSAHRQNMPSYAEGRRVSRTALCPHASGKLIQTQIMRLNDFPLQQSRAV